MSSTMFLKKISLIYLAKNSLLIDQVLPLNTKSISEYSPVLGNRIIQESLLCYEFWQYEVNVLKS